MRNLFQILYFSLSIGERTQNLISLVQCGICYTVLCTDKHPVQCSKCINTLFCHDCSKKLRNKCGYCNEENVSWLPINPRMKKIIDSFKFQCLYHTNGCQAVLEGKDFQIQKHQNLSCMFKDKKMIKDFAEAKVNCRVCKNNLNRRALTALKHKPGTPHLCDKAENDRYCVTHRSKHNYLYTKERIVFQEALENADE